MIIRKIIILIFISILAFFISCESPPDDHILIPITPPDTSSNFSITSEDSIIVLGDTLILHIHMNFPIYKEGMVDFKDGTFIYFNSLEPIIDTTITHIYKTNGSYNIKVEFYRNRAEEYKYIYVDVLPCAIITFENNPLPFGDTLLIHINMKNPIYYKGTIDFHYGNIIDLDSPVPIMDTTISYLYPISGSHNISFKFFNAMQSENHELSVNILPYYFDLSLSVGSKWIFSYFFEESYPPQSYYIKQYGIHTWEIIAFEIVNGDTIYKVQQVRDDMIINKLGGNPTPIIDTLQVDFFFYQHSINFSWQLFYSIYTAEIPNRTFIEKYPIIIEPNGGGWFAAFNDVSGPYHYHYERSGSHGYSQEEELILTEFIKP
jgi:hypothetical protein